MITAGWPGLAVGIGILIEGERVMQVVNTEDENRWADLARRMVAAEVEDALTHRADEQPTAEHTDLAALLDAVATSSDVEHVLIEVTAIAGEAVMRLSRELGEDPRATLEWIASTRAWRRPR